MVQYERLMGLAKRVGCEAEVRALEQQTEEMLVARHIHIALMGAQGSGKTTLLNGIVGQMLREPSPLGESEKPLRVAFELMDEDERFDCVSVENAFWQKEQAVFYEIRTEDVLAEDNALSELMNGIDFVFYVISALVPMSSADLKALGLLKSWPVRIILSKTDLLDADNLVRVTDYISESGKSLGLEPPMRLEAADQANWVKQIRFNIPNEMKLDELRAQRAENMIDQARKKVLKYTQKALAENQADWQAAVEQARADELKNKRTDMQWNQLTADMREKGLLRARDVEKAVMTWQREIVDSMMQMGKIQGFSSGWEKTLDSGFRRNLRQRSGELSRDIQEKLDEDMTFMSRHACQLGLVETERQLMALMDRPFEQGMNVPDGAPLQKKFSSLMSFRGMQKELILSAITVGCAVFAPWQSAVVGGAISAVAAYRAVNGITSESEKWKEDQWHKTLWQYVGQNLRMASVQMSKQIVQVYVGMADKIALYAQSLEVKLDDSQFVRKNRDLEAIAAMLTEE